MTYLLTGLFIAFGGFLIWKNKTKKEKPTPKPEPPKEEIPEPKVFHIILREGIDQTLSVQEQINAIPDGTPELPNIIIFPEGRFWTEGDPVNDPKGKKGIIRLENRHNLVLEGGTFFTKSPATEYDGNISEGNYSHRRHFWLWECSNIILRKIRVEGSNGIEGELIGTTPELTPDFWKGGPDKGSFKGAPAYKPYWEQEHAFDIRGSKNVTIEDCEVFGVWGDGVYVGGTTVPSTGIVLKNLHLKFTGRQGIAAANNVDGLLIDSIWVDHGRRAAIDLEPHSDGGYVTNVEIKNCKLHAIQIPLAAIGRGRVDNINFHDNEYSGGNAIVCFDSSGETIRKNWIIRNNKRTGSSFGSPAASMKFIGVDNIIIEGNTDAISKTQSQKAITFQNCGGELIVTGNNWINPAYVEEIDNRNEVVTEGNTPLK